MMFPPFCHHLKYDIDKSRISFYVLGMNIFFNKAKLYLILSIIIVVVGWAINTQSYNSLRLTPNPYIILTGVGVFLLTTYLNRKTILTKKLSMFVALVCFIFILAFDALNPFTTNGRYIAKTYSCNDYSISAVEHFQSGVDLYKNNGWNLQLITRGETQNNVVTKPYKLYYTSFKPEISIKEQIEIADCIPYIDITQYNSNIDVCAKYSCKPENYIFNNESVGDRCIKKIANGKAAQCGINFTTY
jgi:hypothetical protein